MPLIIRAASAHPRRNPPVLSPTTRGGKPNMAYPLSRDDPKLVDVVCDDVVLLTLQYSTHGTARACGPRVRRRRRRQKGMVFYNGFRAASTLPAGRLSRRQGSRDRGHKGATRLGVENMAQTGVRPPVMIDLLAHFGRRAKWSATTT